MIISDILKPLPVNLWVERDLVNLVRITVQELQELFAA